MRAGRIAIFVALLVVVLALVLGIALAVRSGGSPGPNVGY